MKKISKSIINLSKTPTKHFSSIFLVALLGLVYLLPISYLFDIKQTMCIHKILFHFDCPGCGMTRAIYSFLHFNFREAVKLNFGVLFIIPLFIFEIMLTIRFNRLLDYLKNIFYFCFMFSLVVIYIIRLSQYVKTFF